ncbi:MAG: GntR family transcriptional regulator, partial [Deltaproteobacteria bacterium]|nr:GntR family transcriptional regulator [Deltaproteobacteria bacterium]
KSSEAIRKLESVISAMEKAAHKRNEAIVSEDMRFHQSICELSGHRKLLEMWLTLKDQLLLFVALEEHSYEQPDQLVKTHYPIMEAIRSGDGPRAEKCIRDHLKDAMNVLKEILQASMEKESKQGQ